MNREVKQLIKDRLKELDNKLDACQVHLKDAESHLEYCRTEHKKLTEEHEALAFALRADTCEG